MSIVDGLKGLFRRADTGAAGPAVADPPPANPPEAVASVLNPSSVEGSSGPNSTVPPDLGELETPSASAREIPVTESEAPAEQVKVDTSLPAESEEPKSDAEVEGAIPPSSPTASEVESQA